MSQKQVKKLVDEFEGYLEGHVIERKSEHVWLCKNPKTSEWWFTVALAPCMVSISGDVNTLVMHPYESNPFGWATGRRWDGCDYPLGKAPSSMDLKEFYPDDARDYLKQHLKDAEGYDEEDKAERVKFVKTIRESWDGETSRSFVDAQWEAGDDEPYDGRSWSRGTLVSFVCFCWWARKIREDPSYA